MSDPSDSARNIDWQSPRTLLRQAVQVPSARVETLSLSRSHTLSLSLLHTHTLSLTHTRFHVHTLSYTLSHSLSLSLTLTLSLSHSRGLLTTFEPSHITLSYLLLTPPAPWTDVDKKTSVWLLLSRGG